MICEFKRSTFKHERCEIVNCFLSNIKASPQKSNIVVSKLLNLEMTSVYCLFSKKISEGSFVCNPTGKNKDRFCKNQSAPLFTKSFSALDQLCVTSHKTGKLWRNFCRNRPLGLRRRARGFRTHSKLFLVFHLTMDISKILPLAFAIRHQKRQKISILNHQYFPPYFSL